MVPAQEQNSFIVKLNMPSPYSELIQDSGGLVIRAEPLYYLQSRARSGKD